MIKHMAVIMDGNRRWAQKKGMQAWLGHQQGTQAVEAVIAFCLEQAIPYLSLYAFSLENFKRSEIEKKFLFNLIIAQAEKHLPDFIKQGVKVRFVGDRTLFPEHVRVVCDRVERETEALSALHLDFLFCYSGQQEIVHAAQRAIELALAGTLHAHELTPERFSTLLWNYGMPEPDLIIRTGGKQRLSNFLPFQSAYSELYFTDCLWPDITREHLERALAQYNDSIRNFGA